MVCDGRPGGRGGTRRLLIPGHPETGEAERFGVFRALLLSQAICLFLIAQGLRKK